MVTVKEAAEQASEYLLQLYSNVRPDQIRLEEVELTDDEKYWLITLSVPDGVINRTRAFKVFRIDSITGQVQAMKIRSV